MKARGERSIREMAPPENSRSVSRARSAAFDILRRVEDEGAYASVLLASQNETTRPDDRALCYELVLGVLRWQLWLDSLIDHFADRKAEGLDKPVRRALRLGLYELRFLSRIPASATVNEAVNLVYAARVRSAAGFVNAVLRSATREKDYDPSTAITDPVERLAVATSHPPWLIERWISAFGWEVAEAFARANNEAPPVAFRLASPLADDDVVFGPLLEAGASITPSRIVPQAWRVEGATATIRALAHDGLIYVQDEASQLIGRVLGAQAGECILDVCAAPGSKTTHIALLAPEVALIVAGDIYEHRLRTVRETVARMGLRNIVGVVHDATIALPFMDQSFDRVVVDAPCSGTGTLRRNPEIRWRISTEDFADMAIRQLRILKNSAAVVRNGGRLLYSTCSVEIDENEEVVEVFLRDNIDFRRVVLNIEPLIQRPDGTLRTWPQRDGSDGFFIAAFERRG